jgi:hypothetical protein
MDKYSVWSGRYLLHEAVRNGKDFYGINLIPATMTAIVPTNIHLIDAPSFNLAAPPLGALPPPEPFEEPDPPPDPPAPAALAATVKMGMALPVNEV